MLNVIDLLTTLLAFMRKCFFLNINKLTGLSYGKTDGYTINRFNIKIQKILLCCSYGKSYPVVTISIIRL